jgi:hypothetical protein
MQEFDKYAKVVILSTLAEPKKLLEISIDWFNNSGRLYQPTIIKEVKQAVKDKWLIEEKKGLYRANVKKLLESFLSDLQGEAKALKNYKEKMRYFYFTLGDFTQKVYLNYDVIKVLTKLDQNNVHAFDIKQLFQLPLLIRYLEKQGKQTPEVFAWTLDLEEYLETIGNLEVQYYPVLKKQEKVDGWVEVVWQLNECLYQMKKKRFTPFSEKLKALKILGG